MRDLKAAIDVPCHPHETHQFLFGVADLQEMLHASLSGHELRTVRLHQ